MKNKDIYVLNGTELNSVNGGNPIIGYTIAIGAVTG